MSNLANPYQAPQEDGGPGEQQPGRAGAFRVLNGDTLVAEKGAVLPAICLWNGDACSGGRRQTNFAWAPSWTLLFIVSPLLYILVYLLARKRGRLSYCLGTEAQRRRKQAAMLVVGALLLGVPLVAIGVSRDVGSLVILASLALFGALIAAVVLSPTLRVLRIDARQVHLKLGPAAAAAFSRAQTEGS